jgi:hypothetical protein
MFILTKDGDWDLHARADLNLGGDAPPERFGDEVAVDPLAEITTVT